jgi:hypothetical protein
MAYAMSVNNKNVFLAIKEVVLARNQLGGEGGGQDFVVSV